jgi:hypothetical protein
MTNTDDKFRIEPGHIIQFEGIPKFRGCPGGRGSVSAAFAGKIAALTEQRSPRRCGKKASGTYPSDYERDWL